ncbi:MAG: heme biosynthesis protein HemY [Rhizobiales bacterium]|nr:heme biosynthesis protein HemY [Hyphomicrobiales bacterium]
MIRVLLFFIIVGIVAIGAAWLADRPGDLVLTWLGYRIELSLMAAAILLAIVLIVSVFVWSLIRSLAGTPGALGGFLRNRRTEKGFDALTRGMIAIGSGDAQAASRYSTIADRVMGDQPLALLLRAQAAQLKGDQKAAKKAFDAMLGAPETENLGLRGLFIEAERQKDAGAMLNFAEQALERNRAVGWAATALFEMQCAARKWRAALETLAENHRHGLIDKQQQRRWRAVLLTGLAVELEQDDSDQALILAEEAYGLAPDLVPASVLTGTLLGAVGNVRKATRILEKAWKAGPHPEIAEAYANVRVGDSVRDRLKRVINLAQKTPDSLEGAIAIAGAAIDALDWKEAREALEPFIATRPSQQVCTLMAEIDEGEHGDRGRAREWLSRGMRAARDPVWTADGLVVQSWAPVSPISGRLDAFEWKVPVERLAGVDDFDDDDSLEPFPDLDVGDEALDLTPLEEVSEVPEPSETTGEISAEQLEEIDEPASPSARKKAKTTGRNRAAKRKVAVAPDDPGADGSGFEDEDAALKS